MLDSILTTPRNTLLNVVLVTYITFLSVVLVITDMQL